MPVTLSDYILQSLAKNPVSSFTQGLQEAQAQRAVAQMNSLKEQRELQALVQALQEQPWEVQSATFGGKKAREDYQRAIAEKELKQREEDIFAQFGLSNAEAQNTQAKQLALQSEEERIGAQATRKIKQEELGILQEYGRPTAQAELSAAQELGRQRGTAANLNIAKTITDKQKRQQEAVASQGALEQQRLTAETAARKAHLEQVTQQQRAAYNLISPFDLTNPQGVAAAVGTLQGAGFSDDLLKSFQSNPTGYKEFLYTSLASMDSLSEERLALKRQSFEKSKAKNNSKGSELIDLQSHERTAAVTAMGVKLAGAMLGDPSAVFKGTPSYQEQGSDGQAIGVERASLISALSQTAVQYGQTQSSSLPEFYDNINDYTDAAMTYYQSSLEFYGGNQIEALRAVPDTPQQFAEISSQIANIKTPGTPSFKFNRLALTTPNLNDEGVRQSLIEQGIALGLDIYSSTMIIEKALKTRSLVNQPATNR